MRLIKTLIEIKGAQWQDAAGWLAFTLLLGLLPFWGGLVLWGCGYVSWLNLIDHGQFAIFTAPVLSAGLYFVARDYNNKEFPGRLFFILIFAILLVLVTLVFAGSTIRSEHTTVNVMVLRATSIAMFVISGIFVFIVSAINEHRQRYSALHGDEMTELESDFELAGGQND